MLTKLKLFALTSPQKETVAVDFRASLLKGEHGSGLKTLKNKRDVHLIASVSCPASPSACLYHVCRLTRCCSGSVLLQPCVVEPHYTSIICGVNIKKERRSNKMCSYLVKFKSPPRCTLQTCLRGVQSSKTVLTKFEVPKFSSLTRLYLFKYMLILKKGW